MKYLLLILTFSVWVNTSLAQNLVVNPSFEDVNCPIRYTGFPNQIDQYVNGWRSGNCASPDLYAPCSQDSITRPPAAWYGRQTARTGTNFAAVGFYNIGSIPWYEYLINELQQPLTAGQQYAISFWVSRADGVRYATADIGIAFSNTLDTCLGGFEGPVFSYQTAIKGINTLNDTAGWTQVSGLYTATGTERYLVLGCFTPWSQLITTDHGSGQNRCYYYVDDVEVKANAVSNNDLADHNWHISPNPFSDHIHISGLTHGSCILRNALGKKIFQQELGSSTRHAVNTSALARGVYFLEVISGAKVLRKKLVKRD